MWQQLLKWLPGLIINAVGPIIDVVQGKDREKLRNVQRFAEHARDGLLTKDDAIVLILREFEE